MNTKHIILLAALATALPISIFAADFSNCLNILGNSDPAGICNNFITDGKLPSNHYDPDIGYDPYTSSPLPNNYYIFFGADFFHNPNCLNTPNGPMIPCDSFTTGNNLTNNDYNSNIGYDPYIPFPLPDNHYNADPAYLSNNRYDPKLGTIDNINLDANGLIGAPVQLR
ncbi:hypothetical protein TAO_0844 [Candidatus Nitrosoglobus terrae]|uniref:Secreted protein n=1 Tax=Candidatus Nitrosoglobus terrae TaxID=1630141 RepID=A0A1Q2SM51_9GAMM|nr:hypothetical protein [Candidatus Nitrosoglobus terrae]BAW80214.1 hypothetical protein TAO_0844 [Candidatus Nitrosoglobus terrae]